MLEHEVTITNPTGLHAQASAKLVQVLAVFKSQVTLSGKGREVNAKSIMGVMLLAAGPGTVLKVKINGDDEEEALKTIKQFFAEM
ncbi:MAG: HPr family phosphocarrier protein [Methylococcales bacterium]